MDGQFNKNRARITAGSSSLENPPDDLQLEQGLRVNLEGILS